MIFLSSMGLVLLMGFYGSWHCGAMCGPITMNLKRSSSFWIYQMGRLVSYLLMTILLFKFAQVFLKSNLMPLRVGASFLMSFSLFLMAYFNYKNGKPTPDLFSQVLNFISFKQQKKIFAQPLLLGLLTGLFPCGWFYSFLLLAQQMPDIKKAFVLIMIFWSTGLPALFSFRGVMLKIIQDSPVRYQKISTLVLVFAGVLSILGQWSWYFNSF